MGPAADESKGPAGPFLVPGLAQGRMKIGVPGFTME